MRRKDADLLFLLLLVLAILIAIIYNIRESKKQDFEDEARHQATRFWSSRAFSRCGNDSFVGDYFGKRDGKIYEFYGVSGATSAQPSVDDPFAKDYEWYGEAYLLTLNVRTFENGKWTEWQKTFDGPIRDAGRKAIISKFQGQWIFGYLEKDNPYAYTPPDCREIEALNPPPDHP